MSQFGRVPEKGKITISSIDDEGKTSVEAQFNPKELQIDRTVPWSPTGETNKDNKTDKAKSNHGIHLEFTGAQGRSLSIELLFDQYEQHAGDGFSVSVAERVAKLEELASVRKPGSDKEDDRRPHWCMVTWGGALRGFRCVIESLSTKYTMFDDLGNPLRAICTVKLKEADSVKAKSEAKAGGAPGGT
jgi:hypothetical protein